MDPVQPSAAHSQWVSRWHAICFTAFVAVTAWAVMLCTGTTADCSDVPGMLRHMGGSSYAAVSAIFMQPVVASMTAQDLEPAQSMPVQDPVRKYFIPIMVMLIALLITCAMLVLHGLLRMQRRSTSSVQPEPCRHDTQAASDDVAQLAAEPIRAPARSEQVSLVYVACLNTQTICACLRSLFKS